MAVAKNRFCGLTEEHLNAKLFHAELEVAAADGIELAFHQAVHEVDDFNVATLHLETARGFETEEAAANDNRLGLRTRAGQQGLGVSDGAKGVDAVLIEALDGREEGRTASGN